MLKQHLIIIWFYFLLYSDLQKQIAHKYWQMDIVMRKRQYIKMLNALFEYQEKVVMIWFLFLELPILKN